MFKRKDNMRVKSIGELKIRIRRFLYDAFINGNMDWDGITDKIIIWTKELINEEVKTNVQLGVKNKTH